MEKSKISPLPIAATSSSALPFSLSNNNSVTILPLNNTRFEKPLGSTTTPRLRETSFGQTLGIRTKFQETIGGENCVGPPDLVHRAIYAGSRSALYHHTDFTYPDSDKNDDKESDDGYVGYYHYVNGIRFEKLEQDIQKYICEILGIEREQDLFYFKPTSLEKLGSTKREIIVTYCTYNIFNKSDFRARFVIQPPGIISPGPGGGAAHNAHSKRSLVLMDSTFQIIPTNTESQRSRKIVSFNSDTIQDLSRSYWEELRASHLIRLFHHTDNPETQLTGLVNYTHFIDNKEALISSMIILIKLLPKGSLAGVRSSYGTPTACGNKEDALYKTNYYRNKLIDTLLRLGSLDISGEVCEIAIKQIKSRYHFGNDNGDWDFVNLKLLKIQRGTNKELEYLSLINSSIRYHGLYTTQSALILLDQVSFLISKERYDLALDIAKKCVLILPLDYDCWYYLALSYILVKDFENALLVINSFPISMNNNKSYSSADIVEGGIKDLYMSIFIDRLNTYEIEEEISSATFNEFFPHPKVRSSTNYPSNLRSKKPPHAEVELGSIQKLWHDSFLFHPHLRHPIVGPYFTQSPLVNGSALEIASVETNLIKLCGPNSAKNILASQSAGTANCSLLDFSRKSTWARTYDLLSLLVALIGWEQIIATKETVFHSSSTELRDDSSSQISSYVVNHESSKERLVTCENWLDQLFVIIYEDLRTLMIIGSNKAQQRSALEWEMIGLLGWLVKYNLRESISSLVTSVVGTNVEGGFDYFGTIQVLEIYDEFVLSDICDSCIDTYHDNYDGKFLSNKLILKVSSKDMFDSLIKSLEQEYLTLDFILLCVMKLISWNIRWNQYTPNYLIMKILSTLILKYDSIYIMTRLKIAFEQHKKQITKHNKFTLAALLGGGSSSKSKHNQDQKQAFEFNDDDTIYQYMETLISWIDSLKT
ncbi:CHS6 [[Candida] subhashii]|uniref:CHS6 n=1 Tax=[Candida] subhashii TaxID=561895 RepID=A0A8J5UGL3_9ASCO|nr:CHS6 [[Candida] subhashii]KAG7660362.1 CHS6 [[Candida] subhashii]